MKSKKYINVIVPLVLAICLCVSSAYAYVWKKQKLVNSFNVSIGDASVQLNASIDKNKNIKIDSDEVYEDITGGTALEGCMLTPEEAVRLQPYVENTGNTEANVYVLVGLPKIATLSMSNSSEVWQWEEEEPKDAFYPVNEGIDYSFEDSLIVYALRYELGIYEDETDDSNDDGVINMLDDGIRDHFDKDVLLSLYALSKSMPVEAAESDIVDKLTDADTGSIYTDFVLGWRLQEFISGDPEKVTFFNDKWEIAADFKSDSYHYFLLRYQDAVGAGECTENLFQYLVGNNYMNVANSSTFSLQFYTFAIQSGTCSSENEEVDEIISALGDDDLAELISDNYN